MKKFRVLATALAAAAFLAGCGGNEAGNQAPRVAFTQMVNFGDSLSDVGSYDVGVVAAQGGGHYSINGQGATGLLYINWTEFLAAQLQLTQPCAAETGLDTNSTVVVGFGPVAPVFHDAGSTPCYNYAQGGARVTQPIGPGNVALLNLSDPTTYSNAVGQLTVPVVTQVNNFLTDTTAANAGKFSASTLVTVFAGGNDLFIDVATFQAAVAAGEDETTAATTAVAAMVQAADDEAAIVNTTIIGTAGATHVIVVNLPDVSQTPYAIASGAAGQALVLQMTTAFNTELAAKLTAGSSLLFVDAFTASQDQVTNMAQYGLSNVTTPVCTSSSSLVCTKATLISAVSADPTLANGYEYADDVHPTPYGYRLLSELVGEQMAIKGWL